MIALLKGRFVPVAVDQHVHRRMRDEEGEFFARVLRQAGRGLGGRSQGVYLFTADGTYESSLILFDDLWTDGRLDVRGEIVMAVPSRELLLVTGTGNEEGMARLKEVAEEVHREGAPYRLSKSLFVYRGGKFEVLR